MGLEEERESFVFSAKDDTAQLLQKVNYKLAPKMKEAFVPLLEAELEPILIEGLEGDVADVFYEVDRSTPEEKSSSYVELTQALKEEATQRLKGGILTRDEKVILAQHLTNELHQDIKNEIVNKVMDFATEVLTSEESASQTVDEFTVSEQSIV